MLAIWACRSILRLETRSRERPPPKIAPACFDGNCGAIQAPAEKCSCIFGVSAIHGRQKKTALLRLWESRMPGGMVPPSLLSSVAGAAGRAGRPCGCAGYGVYVAVSVMPDAAV